MCDRKKRGIRGEGGEMGIEERVRMAAEVFDRYGSQIRPMIASLVEDEELREDIYQAFFVSLVRRLVPSHLQSAGETGAYIYRDLINDVLDNRWPRASSQRHLERCVKHRN